MLKENGEDEMVKKVTNEQALERIGEKEKPIGSVIFWEEIASFMMPLKDIRQKWKEQEEEEHSSLIMWETEEDIRS